MHIGKYLGNIALLMIVVMGVSLFSYVKADTTQALSVESQISFQQSFENPSGDAKPFIRWWILPGMMNEAETRAEVRKMANAGFGGIEMVAIVSMASFGSAGWNDAMKWALEEANDCGITLDFTIGQSWPIATPDLTDRDDIDAEQAIHYKAVDFTSVSGAAEYSVTGGLPRPDAPFDLSRAYELIAVTAAKRTDGSSGIKGEYDSDSVVDLMKEGAVDETAGSVNWSAPSNGNWTVFYLYRQSTGHMNGSLPVIDHLSKSAAQAVTRYWDTTLMGNPEMRSLYEKNAGSIFCDSLEIGQQTVPGAAFWTDALLDEFQARRGYDLTPYLPTIFINGFYPYYAHTNTIDSKPDFEFKDVGYRIRLDFLKTLTELFSENHVRTLREWSNSHNMALRYQGAYTSPFEVNSSTLEGDIPETESWGLHDVMDGYRLQSGAVNMMGAPLYSTESSALIGLAWRQTWTGSHTSGVDGYPNDVDTLPDGTALDKGLLYYLNRQYATGVNRAVLHGFSYRSSLMGQWPGDSFMSMGNFPNEWDDKTPMWTHITQMTKYLSRMQYVLQQGQGNVDLAAYRLYYYDSSDALERGLNGIESAGYTYDFVSPNILDMENATLSTQSGRKILAGTGPSYKALLLDQRVNVANDTQTSSEMPTATAKKILGWAREGLPVVIIGSSPTRTESFRGSKTEMDGADSELAAIVSELKSLSNVRTVADRNGAAFALQSLGVNPDAKPDSASTNVFYHRSDRKAEYYYVYNTSLTDTCRQAVTFTGTGYPYILNAASGEITPATEYTIGRDSVSFDIELKPNESMMVAIAKKGWNSWTPTEHVVESNANCLVYDEDEAIAARTTAAGMYNFKLSDESTVALNVETAAPKPFSLNAWSMKLASWSAGTNALTTSVSAIGPYSLGTELKPWNEIDPALGKAAGVATYQTSFRMSKGWTDGIGAMLEFERVSDTIRLMVNGKEVAVNQLSNRVDIGSLLIKGKNTVEVEVTSNLANIKQTKIQEFGIIGKVTVTPYVQTSLADGERTPYVATPPVSTPPAVDTPPVGTPPAVDTPPDEVNMASLSDVTAAKIANYAWTGKQIKPAFSLQLAGNPLRPNIDYTLTYGANVNIGKGTVTVTGKGSYAGSKTFSFHIVPRKTSISKVAVSKGKVKIAWKKAAAAQKITKYQLQYRQKGKSKWMTKYASAKSVSKTLTLKNGKRYQFRIRTYKTVAGVKYYASWSAIKTSKAIR